MIYYWINELINYLLYDSINDMIYNLSNKKYDLINDLINPTINVLITNVIYNLNNGLMNH
jgi:hypothetical protein